MALRSAANVIGVLCCDWSSAFGEQLPSAAVASIERASGVRERWSSSQLRRLDTSLIEDSIEHHGPDRLLIVPYRSLPGLGHMSYTGVHVQVAGVDPTLADRLDDKLYQRQLFTRLEIPCPPWTAVAHAATPPNDARWYPGVMQGRHGSLGGSTVPVDGPGDVTAAAAGLGAGPFLLSERLDGPVLNVHAVVGKRGVQVSWPSVQVVGALPCCGLGATFAYCGNDFSAAQMLPPHDRRQLAAIAGRIGAQLAQLGYCGIFGLDAILAADGLRVLEINPRFQGSTRRLTMAEVAEGEPTTVGAHLDVFDAQGRCALKDAMPRPLKGSQLVVYHTGTSATRAVRATTLPGVELDGWPAAGTLVQPQAILGRIHIPGTVLSSNLTTLTRDAEELAGAARLACFGSESASADRA